MIKNKRLIFLILILFSFIIGFFFDRVEIFQYKRLISLKDFILKKNFYSEVNNEFRDLRFKYPNYNDPNLDIIEIILERYKYGTNIFIDRNYRNNLNDEFLNGLFIVKLPVHSFKGPKSYKIKLEVYESIKVYRALCKKNKNNYSNNWKLEKQEILIIGGRCIYKKIVSKKFDKGVYYLDPGGPIAVDPIFIEQNDYKNLHFELQRY